MSAGACSRGRGYVGGGRRGAVRHGRHRAPDAMVRPTLMSPPPFHGDSPFGPRRVTENNTGWDLLRTWSGLGQVCGQAPSTISSHTAPDSVHAPAREHPQHVIGCSARTRPLPSSCKGLLPGWRHGESNPGPPACKSPTTKRVGLHRAPIEVPQWPADPSLDLLLARPWREVLPDRASVSGHRGLDRSGDCTRTTEYIAACEGRGLAREEVLNSGTHPDV